MTIVSSIVAALIVTYTVWLVKKAHASREAQAIYDFLRQSKEEGRFVFRSTSAISAHTRIPESRVAELCSRHPKIRRNEKERQTWRIEN